MAMSHIRPTARLTPTLAWIATHQAEPMKNPPNIQAARVVEHGVIDLV
jgi:hypothetical protein